MRKLVRFEAAFHTGVAQAGASDLVVEKLAELKRLYPDVDAAQLENMSHGHPARPGAQYKVHLDGTIAFRPGVLPDWEQLNRAGEECFGFEDFKAVPMVRGFPGPSSLEVHCRMCGRKVGEITDGAGGAAACRNGEVEERVDAVRQSHLAEQHPEADPGLL
jgi:hypothetical protein